MNRLRVLGGWITKYSRDLVVPGPCQKPSAPRSHLDICDSVLGSSGRSDFRACPRRQRWIACARVLAAESGVCAGSVPPACAPASSSSTSAPPTSPPPPAVRRYLREFLGDPRVHRHQRGRPRAAAQPDHPAAPARRSRRAPTRTIWDAERGSPLLYHSRDLAAGGRRPARRGWHVELAMRYGSAVDRRARSMRSRGREVERIVVLPLFPQYASSSTGTAIARVMELAGAALERAARSTSCRRSTTIPASSTAFAAGRAARCSPSFAPDHVLFSFHGLPVRQIVKTDRDRRRTASSARPAATRSRNPQLLPRAVVRDRARARRAARRSPPSATPSASSRGSAGRRGSSRTPIT